MAMTEQELYEIATELAKRIFVQATITAHSNLDQLKDAAEAIDTGMNATTNQLQTFYPGEVVKLAFLDYAKDQASDLTNQQAGIALAFWSLKEVGLL